MAPSRPHDPNMTIVKNALKPGLLLLNDALIPAPPEQRQLMIAEMQRYINKLSLQKLPPGMAPVVDIEVPRLTPSQSIATRETSSSDLHYLPQTGSSSIAEQIPQQPYNTVSRPSPPQEPSQPQRKRPHDTDAASLDPRPDLPSTEPPPAKRPRTRSKALKPLSHTRKLNGPNEWNDISLDMTDEYHREKLLQAREKFYRKLLKLPDLTSQRNKQQPTETESTGVTAMLFDEVHAAKMTSFFFEDTMGEAGLTQLAAFANRYSKRNTGEHDLGAPHRFKSIATDPKAPALFRTFFAAYCADIKDIDTNSNDPALKMVKHIEDVTRGRTTLNEYRRTCQGIDIDNNDLWPYITEKIGIEKVEEIKRSIRLTTTQGVSHASIARDLLAAVGQVPRKALISRTDRAKAIDALAVKLGDAYLLFTPPSSMGFLKEMGIGRVNAACDTLLTCCPFIPNVVRVVHQYIWEPYQRGDAELPILSARLAGGDGQSSFLSRLQSAWRAYEQHQLLPLVNPSTLRITEVSEDDNHTNVTPTLRKSRRVKSHASLRRAAPRAANPITLPNPSVRSSIGRTQARRNAKHRGRDTIEEGSTGIEQSPEEVIDNTVTSDLDDDEQDGELWNQDEDENAQDDEDDDQLEHEDHDGDKGENSAESALE